MSKLDQLIANKPFRISFVISFLVCFLGVMTGFERTIIDLLVVATGVAIGFSGAMGFRRWRGDFKP